MSLLKKVRLEIAVTEDFVKKTINVIVTRPRTSKIGDGKIFIPDMDEGMRIRTGERGKKAIG